LVSFTIGLVIAIVGYIPNISDPEIIINICWAFIFGGGLGMFLLAFIAGFAHDIQEMADPPTGIFYKINPIKDTK
jgi:hypothetical protein